MPTTAKDKTAHSDTVDATPNNVEAFGNEV